MECRLCGNEFKPKPKQASDKKFINHIEVLVVVIGDALSKDVCDDKSCQAELQHECDTFDAYRKGE